MTRGAPDFWDPISISFEEFNDAYNELEQQGLKLKQDRQQAYKDFAGWRINYDDVRKRMFLRIIAPSHQTENYETHFDLIHTAIKISISSLLTKLLFNQRAH